MTETRNSGFSIAALVAAMLFVALLPVAVALAQESFIPSADVVPANTSPDDPNAGQWFYLELSPGNSAAFEAFVRNPADVPQKVKLYLKDLEFSAGGAAIKEGDQADVGAWGHAEQGEVLVPPKDQLKVIFAITVPSGAEPGDHIGAVVAESQPQTVGQLSVVTVSATRLYVTVPGEARRGLEISSVKPAQDSLLFPSRISVTAIIKNTGRIRLDMGVTVGGSEAKGPKVLLSQSNETYIGEARVPFWGGPVNHSVEAEDRRSGLIRRANASTFVIPWGLVLLLGVASMFAWGMKRWWDRRASTLAKLQADIRRLETLIATRPVGPLPSAVPEEEEDELDAILAALKRARRTGSQPSLERLALALHTSGADALDVLLEALEKADPERRAPLVEAAATYGAASLVSQARMERLAADLAAEITLLASREGAAVNGRKRPDSSANARPSRAKRKPPATRHKPKPKPKRR